MVGNRLHPRILEESQAKHDGQDQAYKRAYEASLLDFPYLHVHMTQSKDVDHMFVLKDHSIRTSDDFLNILCDS